MRRLLIALPLVALPFAAGCGLEDDGPRTAQTRDVAAFTRVDNEDSVNLHLHVGQPRKLRVSAGEKVIRDVKTTVKDGTLRVRFDHHGWGGQSVDIDAWTPSLTGIAADGSGDIDAEGLRSDALDVRSDGSADLRLNGAAGALKVDLGGSGDAQLGGLQARQAQVVVGGSGDAEVRADDRLDVKVDGSGDVRYHGQPAIIRNVDGSGDVSPVG